MRIFIIITSAAFAALFFGMSNVQVEAEGVELRPTTSQLLSDTRERLLERFNFDECNLDTLIRFDPEGYAALGETSHEDWTEEYREWMGTFHVWTHTTQHALYLARYAQVYVCSEGVSCTNR